MSRSRSHASQVRQPRVAAARPATDAAMPPAGSFEPGWSRREWLFVLGVLAVVLLAYVPVWHAGFIWDDDSHVTSNPCIIGPLGLKEIWTSSAGFYFPLVSTTFWLLHALWGLNPVPYHLINVVLHAVSAVLLWRVLRRLRIRGAWLGALLWALHPVQAESVAWISELKNTQSGVFYLLAILFFLRWTTERSFGATTDAAQGRRGAGRWYALAWLSALAAILSKSSTVMLPMVLGLCWWWMDQRWRWRQVLWLIPFLVISVTASLWTIWEQKFHSGASGADWTRSPLERLIIAGNDLWFYVGKLVWPHPLIFIYPRWAPDASSFAAYLPVLGAIATLGVLWWWRRRTRPVLFAAGYFGVSLFPVLGFFDVYFFRYSYVGDHFQYLASMGVLALAGAAIVTGVNRIRPNRPVVLAGVAGALLLTCGIATARQSTTYRNMVTLYQTIIDRNPGCSMAYYNLGNTRRSAGRTEEAIALYQQSLQVDPNMPDAQTALGIALEETGKGDEAVAHFEEALRLDPNYAVAHNHLGVALAQAGRLDDALAHFERALQLNPALADAHNNLGNTLRAAGRPAEAMAQYEEALRLNPAYVDAHNNLGNALGQAGNIPEAIAQFEQSLRLNPDQPEVHNSLGIVLLMAERSPDAIAHFEAALRLNPHLAQVENNLAMALESVGRTNEAAVHYAAARRLGAQSAPK